MKRPKKTTTRILISGGSGGLGQAICRQLANRGISPIICFAKNQERAFALANETNGEALQLDLCDNGSIEYALSHIGKCENPVEGVVLAAAQAPVLAPFGRIDDKELRRQIEISAIGPRRLLAGIVKQQFRKQKKGNVVAVLSSSMGNCLEGATSSMGSYIVGKHAMQGMLAALAADYPWLQVRAVRPSFIDTDMLRVFDERFLDMIRDREAIASPDEVATKVCELL